jgi:hypothetical protein
MRESYKKGKNHALAVLCTNDAGLYGLTRSDDATKRRLVIVMFKKNDMSEEQWKEYKELIDDPNFGYSLYMYVYDEWGERGFNPDAFITEYDMYSELKSMKKNPVETFNELLTLNNGSLWTENTRDIHYNIVNEYNGAKLHYFYIHRSVALHNFNLHSLQGNRSKMTEETFKSEMKQLGWNYDRKRISGELLHVFYRDTFVESVVSESESEGVEEVEEVEKVDDY